MHSPTPTHTYPHSPTLCQKKVTLTHTQSHPAKNQSHSSTPSQKKVTLTHTQPHLTKTGHTHPHLPHPDKKGHTQPKEGHIHPHITERKKVMCLTHMWKYYLFTLLAGVFIFAMIDQFIFFYWILLKQHLNHYVCLFSTIS